MSSTLNSVILFLSRKSVRTCLSLGEIALQVLKNWKCLTNLAA